MAFWQLEKSKLPKGKAKSKSRFFIERFFTEVIINQHA